MTEETAFVASIEANPGVDLHWQIFSDYLKDTGRWDWPSLLKLVCTYPDVDGVRLMAALYQEEFQDKNRAEFIRLQCEIAQLYKLTDSEVHNTGMCSPHCTLCPRREQLRYQTSRLLYNLGNPDLTANNVHQWAAKDCKALDNLSISYSFDKGFIGSITCAWNDWKKYHQELLAGCPLRQRAGQGRCQGRWMPNTGGQVILSSMPTNTELRQLRAKHNHFSPLVLTNLLAVEFPGMLFVQRFSSEGASPLRPVWNARRPTRPAFLLGLNVAELGLPEGREWREVQTLAHTDTNYLEIVCECSSLSASLEENLLGSRLATRRHPIPVRVVTLEAKNFIADNIHRRFLAGACERCGVISYTRPFIIQTRM
jgi:uncharacterized protein (TIGR02996 family)